MFVWRARAARGAVALAAVVGLLSCSTPDTRTEAERAADRALVKNVELALRNERYVDADHIDVDVDRGIVRLSGKVGSDSDLREVLRVAAAVPGVRRVDDQLEIMDFGRTSPRL
jgi:osmotically-inducible protein OsmY